MQAQQHNGMHLPPRHNKTIANPPQISNYPLPAPHQRPPEMRRYHLPSPYQGTPSTINYHHLPWGTISSPHLLQPPQQQLPPVGDTPPLQLQLALALPAAGAQAAGGAAAAAALTG